MSRPFYIMLISMLFLLSGCAEQGSTQVKATKMEKRLVTPSHDVGKQDGQKADKGTASTHRWEIYRGRISKTFSSAARKSGIPSLHIRKLEELFSEQVNFRKDIQKGDHFTVVFQPGADGTLQSGKILAAELNNRGKPVRVIKHTNRRGESRFYSGDGTPLEADFLRSPLKNTKVSSHFTMRRYHPVLKKYRPHRGTDFIASNGTPVMATAGGVVEKRERQRGYGNVIFLSHAGGKYTTVYAHLSRFAKKLKVGTRVRQGEVIGYSGSTGLATGPHLHYEFRKDGEYKDAMKVALPRTHKLSMAERKYFYQATARLRKVLLSGHKSRQLARAQ